MNAYRNHNFSVTEIPWRAAPTTGYTWQHLKPQSQEAPNTSLEQGSRINTLEQPQIPDRQPAGPPKSRDPYLKHCGGHPVCVSSLSLRLSLCLVLHCPFPSPPLCTRRASLRGPTCYSQNPLTSTLVQRDGGLECVCRRERLVACVWRVLLTPPLRKRLYE